MWDAHLLELDLGHTKADVLASGCHQLVFVGIGDNERLSGSVFFTTSLTSHSGCVLSSQVKATTRILSHNKVEISGTIPWWSTMSQGLILVGTLFGFLLKGQYTSAHFAITEQATYATSGKVLLSSLFASFTENNRIPFHGLDLSSRGEGLKQGFKVLLYYTMPQSGLWLQSQAAPKLYELWLFDVKGICGNP